MHSCKAMIQCDTTFQKIHRSRCMTLQQEGLVSKSTSLRLSSTVKKKWMIKVWPSNLELLGFEATPKDGHVPAANHGILGATRMITNGTT
mmetsp:Transcript_56261/g.103244  ORF Transcript_56261/g.103244 Transcript_56261/m.103244 type:complete len:90 (+) Transcript_56261:618-887(+)